MSRIGNRELHLPEGVEFSCSDKNLVTIKGPKGTLEKQMPSNIEIICKDKSIKTVRKSNQKQQKQLHGTVNSLLNGMIIGITKGFEKILLINGVGYRASIKDNNLNINLGYSHPIIYKIPAEVNVECISQTEIKVSGIDKQLVGQTAATIRAYRKPEPYKGKGIRYKDEHIIRKQGKSAGK